MDDCVEIFKRQRQEYGGVRYMSIVGGILLDVAVIREQWEVIIRIVEGKNRKILENKSQGLPEV